jgi:ferric-dicitrate binding protein FerR (iron transport regulator)
MNQKELLEKLASGSAGQADYQQFTEWFEALPEEEQQTVIRQYEAIILLQEGGTTPSTIAQKIAQRVNAHEQKREKKKVITMVRWTAAAVLAAGVAGITWLSWWPGQSTRQASAPIAGTQVLHDKQPASQGATLTLADGSTIILDSIGNGNIATQGNMQVTKNNGQIIYTAPQQPVTSIPGHNSPPTTYNTMATPRGRQFKLILPDGSKVWLNAASSIRYPTVFTGTDRQVTITGEAYFEVEKMANKPFKVSFYTPAAGSGEVEVLGTHFNINAYGDEATIKTTLLEGKVKIAPVNTISPHPIVDYTLTPGKQGILALLSDQSPQVHIQVANTEEVMAWKNGRFQFNHTPIKDIMRQVSRWYDVDIIYPKTIPEKEFTADLSRQTRLSELLKALELSGFRFTIDAKTLTVTM